MMEKNSTAKLFGRDFTLMVIGQVISLFGNAVLRFALSVFVLDMTGSAAAFATISALSMIPTVLMSPLGGALADRVSRKGIMAVLDFITAGLIIGFAVFSGEGVSVFSIGVMLISKRGRGYPNGDFRCHKRLALCILRGDFTECGCHDVLQHHVQHSRADGYSAADAS